MNLVAKEYVAAQDAADPGVLILSRFAGAARELKGALIVNPFDIDHMAASIHEGLLMPLEERRARWESMMSVLRHHTVSARCDSFIRSLRGVGVPDQHQSIDSDESLVGEARVPLRARRRHSVCASGPHVF
jgi:trehalose 6-phosphate synthase